MFNYNQLSFDEERELINDSGLFDKDWYLDTYKDVANSKIDPLDHFITVGWEEGRNPSKDFNTIWYTEQNSSIKTSHLNPLIHYIKIGKSNNYPINPKMKNEFLFEKNKRIINESGLFDKDWYLDTYKDVANSKIDPLDHFVAIGWEEGRNPSEDFDTIWYIEQNPSIKTTRMNPIVHYLSIGKFEGAITHPKYKEGYKDIETIKTEIELIKNSGLFDKEWYLNAYGDVSSSDVNPIFHYVTIGWKEGRNPSEDFDTKWYIENNLSDKDKNTNPLIHYIITGITDKLPINSFYASEDYENQYKILNESDLFDAEYYIKNNAPFALGMDPINHYLQKGAKEGYNPSKYFDTNWYINTYNDVKNSGLNPLIHYITDGKIENRLIRRVSLYKDYPCKEGIAKKYKIIHDSSLFDEKWYITQYSPKKDMDPILHYIKWGADEGLDPNPFFSSNKYYKTYPDVKRAGLNPLIHYINNGMAEGRNGFISDKLSNNIENKYSFLQSKQIIKALDKPVSIIIPIYNAYEETKKCITSVLNNTHIKYELILINDCSPDKRIDKLLNELKNIVNVTVINNEINLGFIKNVNKGIKYTNNDVVLLNSDTVVTPKWLSKLVTAAYTNNRIGTVTPFTNSSDISIEELAPNTKLDTLYDNSSKMEKLSVNGNIEAPTGNGFCIYVKRDTIDDVGYFDETFGKGYGEETDFTTRAKNKGWKNIRCDSVFVYHRRHASFKKENTELIKKNNMKILKRRYPTIFKEWDDFVKSDTLKESVNNLTTNLPKCNYKKRLLYITTFKNSILEIDDDFKSVDPFYDTYILQMNKEILVLYKKVKDEISIINSWDVLETSNTEESGRYDIFIKLFFNILNNLKIDVFLIPYRCNFYHPRFRMQSVFIKLAPLLEIPAVYTDTCVNEDINNEIEELINPKKSFENIVIEKKENIDFNKKRLVVYTAVTGDYDVVQVPNYINDNVDYICFTDNPHLKSNFWEIRMMDKDLDLDPIRKARYYKIMPHKYLSDYDYSLWIDACTQIDNDITEFINKYSHNNKIFSMKHDIRDCIYDEAEVCIEKKLDDEEIMAKQVEGYRKEGYPEHNGLIASGVIFRDHNDPKVKYVMEKWCEEVVNKSRRDQLSFNYVCWKYDLQFDVCGLFYFNNEYYLRHEHKKDNNLRLRLSGENVNDICDTLNEKVTIIIPIYNAFEQVKSCIESVLRNTSVSYRLLLINDCSSDVRMKPYLDKMEEEYGQITVIHNKENQGFVKNVNIGFSHTDTDVVLLNSDTIVTPKWLTKLVIAAYSKKNIGTVTPLSNNAGAFSVPVIEVKNEVDPRLGVDGTANIIEKTVANRNISVPTGNGFCMYIKRETIYSVGFFDPSFGKGYGEENDFCMRAMDHGWKNIIDESTYIYHDHSASFGTAKVDLMKKNRAFLDVKHPSYTQKVRDFVKSIDYDMIRDDISRTLNCDDKFRFNEKRILYVIHKGSGGALHTATDIISNLDTSYDCYILTSDTNTMNLLHYSDIKEDFETEVDADSEFRNKLTLVSTWKLQSEFNINKEFIPEYKYIYLNILATLKIDIVHIHHLINHSFDLPYVANSMGIPIIFSLHDLYYICPAHELLDEHNKYCEGKCTPVIYDGENMDQCNITIDNLKAPVLKSFVPEWRNRVRKMFEKCSCFISSSKYPIELYTSIYPELKSKPFKYIEHGRDLKTPNGLSDIITVPSEDKPIKILFPGHISVHKGGQLINDIKKLDKDNKLDIHFIGALFGSLHLEECGTYHGYYDRSNFKDEVEKIKPSFIGIFSICPETYCHTLTEALSCGVPVITLDIGATGERIKRDGGGWFINNDPKQAYEKILELAGDTKEYLKVANSISNIEFKTIHKMSKEYENIYNNLLKCSWNVNSEDVNINNELLKQELYELKSNLSNKESCIPIDIINNDIQQKLEEENIKLNEANDNLKILENENNQKDEYIIKLNEEQMDVSVLLQKYETLKSQKEHLESLLDKSRKYESNLKRVITNLENAENNK